MIHRIFLVYLIVNKACRIIARLNLNLFTILFTGLKLGPRKNQDLLAQTFQHKGANNVIFHVGATTLNRVKSNNNK